MINELNELSKYCDIDLNRASGIPVIKETRFTLAQVLAEIADGLSVSDLCQKFELNQEHVVKFLEALSVYFNKPTPDNKHTELRKWINKYIAADFHPLEQLSKRKNGFNEHYPNKKSILNAKEFVNIALSSDMPPSKITASAVGGVGVFFKCYRKVYVEFLNTGIICILFSDTRIEPEEIKTKKITPEDYPEVIQEIKNFLRIASPEITEEHCSYFCNNHRCKECMACWCDCPCHMG